jgi:hypothetical protein
VSRDDLGGKRGGIRTRFKGKPYCNAGGRSGRAFFSERNQAGDKGVGFGGLGGGTAGIVHDFMMGLYFSSSSLRRCQREETCSACWFLHFYPGRVVVVEGILGFDGGREVRNGPVVDGIRVDRLMGEKLESLVEDAFWEERLTGVAGLM